MITIFRSFKLSYFALALIVFNVLDLISTFYFIRQGHTEGGPILVYYYKQFGFAGMAYTKFGLLIGAILTIEYWCFHKKSDKYGIIGNYAYQIVLLLVPMCYFGGILFCHFWDIQ